MPKHGTYEIIALFKIIGNMIINILHTANKFSIPLDSSKSRNFNPALFPNMKINAEHSQSLI